MRSTDVGRGVKCAPSASCLLVRLSVYYYELPTLNRDIYITFNIENVTTSVVGALLVFHQCQTFLVFILNMQSFILDLTAITAFLFYALFRSYDV